MIVIIGIVSIFVNSFVLMYAANYMDIYDADFSKCFIVSLLSIVIMNIIDYTVGGTSWLISALLGVMLIKFILGASWGRAVMTYIVMVVVSIIVGCALAMILVTGACICVPVGS